MTGRFALQLLRYLDARVRRDRAMSGLTGRIVVAVRMSDQVLYWLADFSAGVRGAKDASTVTTAFLSDKPEQYDVAVGLDEAGARQLFGLPPLSATPLRLVTGNTALLQRFTNRYLRDVSPLHARLNNAATRGQR